MGWDVEARTHAALGVVNAIGSGGFGAAAAIELWMTVRARRCDHYSGVAVVRGEKVKVDPAIVEAATSVVEEYLGTRIGPVCVYEETSIPYEAGLKGSSAFINAVVKAAAGLAGRSDLGLLELAKLGVRAARRAGLTVTGALDDHMATLGCGGYATDNRRRRIVAHDPELDASIAIVYWGRRSIRGIRASDYRRFQQLFQAAWRLVLAGDWWRAAVVNGLANALALGLDRGTVELLASLSDGVLAVGVTGKGPSIYVAADTAKEARRAAKTIAERLGGAEVIETRLLNCKTQPLSF